MGRSKYGRECSAGAVKQANANAAKAVKYVERVRAVEAIEPVKSP